MVVSHQQEPVGRHGEAEGGGHQSAVGGRGPQKGGETAKADGGVFDPGAVHCGEKVAQEETEPQKGGEKEKYFFAVIVHKHTPFPAASACIVAQGGGGVKRESGDRKGSGRRTPQMGE